MSLACRDNYILIVLIFVSLGIGQQKSTGQIQGVMVFPDGVVRRLFMVIKKEVVMVYQR